MAKVKKAQSGKSFPKGSLFDKQSVRQSAAKAASMPSFPSAKRAISDMSKEENRERQMKKSGEAYQKLKLDAAKRRENVKDKDYSPSMKKGGKVAPKKAYGGMMMKKGGKMKKSK